MFTAVFNLLQYHRTHKLQQIIDKLEAPTYKQAPTKGSRNNHEQWRTTFLLFLRVFCAIFRVVFLSVGIWVDQWLALWVSKATLVYWCFTRAGFPAKDLSCFFILKITSIIKRILRYHIKAKVYSQIDLFLPLLWWEILKTTISEISD